MHADKGESGLELVAHLWQGGVGRTDRVRLEEEDIPTPVDEAAVERQQAGTLKQARGAALFLRDWQRVCHDGQSAAAALRATAARTQAQEGFKS